MASQVLVGQRHQAPLLSGVDGLVSFSGSETLARLHLRDHQRAAAADDEIDLAAAQAQIAGHDPIAAQPVEPGCPALAKWPEESLRKSPVEKHNTEDKPLYRRWKWRSMSGCRMSTMIGRP